MKRARRALTMFGGGSESDSSADDGRRKHLRPIAQHYNNGSDSDDDKLQLKRSVPPSKPEEDPLEAFMTNLNNEQPAIAKTRAKEIRNTADSESENEAFHPIHAGKSAHEHVELEHSGPTSIEERMAERPTRDLILQPTDHSTKNYSPIMSCDYIPLPRLNNLTKEGRNARLDAIGASVRAGDNISPIDYFQDLALTLPKSLLGAILTDFKQPTPVQKIAIPAALHGCDIIAVAKTGSGKTAAYTIPMLKHISVQAPSKSSGGKGPTALIVAPTRELATQISGVAQRFAETINLSVLCVVGGHAKYEQFKRLRDSGAEVVICTPGRLIDMIKMKACSFGRCSLVVLDEADRMFDLGFGQQVDSLLSQIRPDAQKLLFSATFPKRVESLAKKYLSKPVRIVISHTTNNASKAGEDGKQGMGNQLSASGQPTPMVSESISESYVIVSSEQERTTWLIDKLGAFIKEGLVIVFCQTRGGAAAVANQIRAAGIPAVCVHGETDHADREGLLKMFRSGELPLMITTDMSARGLDIPGIKNVVNYECAKSWEWHVHRVGRTGRASEAGNAHTLICKTSRGDLSFVSEALIAFRKARVPPPAPLIELAPMVGAGDRGSGGRGRRRNHRF